MNSSPAEKLRVKYPDRFGCVSFLSGSVESRIFFVPKQPVAHKTYAYPICIRCEVKRRLKSSRFSILANPFLVNFSVVIIFSP